MSKSSPPQMLRKPIRDYLRQRGEPIMQEIRLQDRADDIVRMSLIKAARDQYDGDLPDTVEQWYDPKSNCVVIPLPEPDADDVADGQATLGVIGKRRGDG